MIPDIANSDPTVLAILAGISITAWIVTSFIGARR